MNATDIEEALRQTFLAAIPAAAAACSFENQPFDPKGKSVWFEFHFMPNKPEVATLGLGGQDEHTGIAQIDIHVPQGSGRQSAKAYIESLRSVFTPSLPLVYNSGVVTIRACGQVPGGVAANSYRFSVSITWEARTSRP